MATDCKSVGFPFDGSNPSLPTTKKTYLLVCLFCGLECCLKHRRWFGACVNRGRSPRTANLLSLCDISLSKGISPFRVCLYPSLPTKNYKVLSLQFLCQIYQNLIIMLHGNCNSSISELSLFAMANLNYNSLPFIL